MAPAPQTTVAQMMNIKSRRCFDVMAVIHSVSDTRNPVGHPPVADVHLVDGTLTPKSKTAEAVVAVWGQTTSNNVGRAQGNRCCFST